MDTTRLERFAKYARRYLMEQVEKKLIQILVYTDGKESEQRRVYSKQVSDLEAEIYRTCHIKVLAGAANIDTKPMQELIERVAYTWFNRFCALRFMDVNGYNKVNVVSPLPGHFQPEILEDAKAGHIDEKMVHARYRTRVFDLLSGKETHPDPQSEAYRILVRSVCNYYADTMPFLFERIEDWTELLMPEDLLSGNSILAYTREAMVPGVCKDVEVIGWLYQFYIAEKKEAAQAGIKKGKKIQSAEQAAVTQLFTPHWIVKYMVQNSLGRLWLQNHPNSTLKDKMEFYVAQDAVPAEDSVSQKRRPALQSPEEIKLCDPCCGSGHVLTYAFDLLFEIYSEMGYDTSRIPRLIIENNLYGIEIDERAAGLAAFALTMKARSKDRAWFSSEILVKPQICKLENISFTEEETEAYLDKCGRDIFTLKFERMLPQFEHADTYGSLIVPYEQDIAEITDLLNAKDFSGDVFLAPTHNKVLTLLSQADYLSSKYQVVVTNPPYLGSGGFGKEKDTWFRANYPNSRSDFFAMFMERCLNLSQTNGFVAMINMQSWMFLSSYEKMRKHLVKHYDIVNMAHLGPRAFDSIGGEVVSTTSFVLQNKKPTNLKGAYFRLIEGRSEAGKSDMYLEAIANPDCGWFYRCQTSDFTKIPGAAIAYWVSDKVRDIFAHHPPLGSIAEAKQGLATADNNRFLRYWFEVSMQRIGLGMKDRAEAHASGKKWFPYNKGGEFRKWYGNQDYVVNWENDGEEIKAFCFDNGKQRSVVRNPNFYFRESVSWSRISSGTAAFRFYEKGFVFDCAGCCFYSDNNGLLPVVMCIVNSIIAVQVLEILAPTLTFQLGDIQKIPYIESNNYGYLQHISLIKLGKFDWNSYETSWNFSELPLLGFRCEVSGIRELYDKLREQWIEMTLEMQELEEENNRILIEAYGLQDELSPEVPLKEITLTCNPYYRYKVDEVLGVRGEVLGVRGEVLGIREEEDPLKPKTYKLKPKPYPINEAIEQRLLADTMKELISYAVGCMFGRYSLDKPGLILANQGEGIEEYLDQVLGVRDLDVRESGSGEAALKPKTYHLTPDNVIPILDGEWFSDDIVSRFEEFLKVSFGQENFSANLSYIEDAIGKDIRNYFLKDFYTDHVKRYKKRPIYWLFSSPSGSFNALIYMHRYSPDTASVILNNYLREYVFKLKNRAEELREQEISGDSSQKEKILARKELDKTEKIISELEYWEKDALYPLATQKISIDLDDGVKVNYAKFNKVLKRIPGLD
jgi:type II restriction/modification system DNA methylase subunit YeeA